MTSQKKSAAFKSILNCCIKNFLVVECNNENQMIIKNKIPANRHIKSSPILNFPNKIGNKEVPTLKTVFVGRFGEVWGMKQIMLRNTSPQ